MYERAATVVHSFALIKHMMSLSPPLLLFHVRALVRGKIQTPTCDVSLRVKAERYPTGSGAEAIPQGADLRFPKGGDGAGPSFIRSKNGARFWIPPPAAPTQGPVQAQPGISMFKNKHVCKLTHARAQAHTHIRRRCSKMGLLWLEIILFV